MFDPKMIQGERDAELWMAGFAAFRERTAAGPLGLECVAISDDEIIIEFDITDNARQPMGLLHGGVSVLVAETASSFHAAWHCDLTKVAPVGIDINGTHIGSATEGRVRATGRVLRRASTFIFHEVEVTHVDTGYTLCHARVTNFYKPH